MCDSSGMNQLEDGHHPLYYDLEHELWNVMHGKEGLWAAPDWNLFAREPASKMRTYNSHFFRLWNFAYYNQFAATGLRL